jgi:hypothetical protein
MFAYESGLEDLFAALGAHPIGYADLSGFGLSGGINPDEEEAKEEELNNLLLEAHNLRVRCRAANKTLKRLSQEKVDMSTGLNTLDLKVREQEQELADADFHLRNVQHRLNVSVQNVDRAHAESARLEELIRQIIGRLGRGEAVTGENVAAALRSAKNPYYKGSQFFKDEPVAAAAAPGVVPAEVAASAGS